MIDSRVNNYWLWMKNAREIIPSTNIPGYLIIDVFIESSNFDLIHSLIVSLSIEFVSPFGQTKLFDRIRSNRICFALRANQTL
jgi:hypothetical protein